MITRLVEKNKLKAHQYWPDDTDETEIGPEIEVSWPTQRFYSGWSSQVAGGVKVCHLSTSFQGSYFLRWVGLVCNFGCWRWWDFWDPIIGNFPSLFPWVRLGRLYSFTRKIGQIWESLMVQGKKMRCRFKISKQQLIPGFWLTWWWKHRACSNLHQVTVFFLRKCWINSFKVWIMF